MLKTLIFDFDGTIADTLNLVTQLFTEISEEYNFSRVENQNITTLKEQGAKAFFKSLDIDPSKTKEIIEVIKKKEESNIQNIAIFPELKEILFELKNRNIRLGILTSNSVENVKLCLNANKINIFDFIISENNLFGKDTVLKQIMDEYKLLPQETAYIGDEDRDIEAAKKAGLISVAVTWGYNSKALLQTRSPDYLIETPQEILNLYK